METAIAKREGGGGYLSNIEEYAMGLEALVTQVALIQQVQEAVMHEDEHYGVIPGTQKPTLFKPGAEKLCMVFRLAPDFEIIREIHEPAMIAYVIKCTLVHNRQGTLFDLLSRPLDELQGMLIEQYAGRTIDFLELYEEHSVDRPYIKKNYKEVLRTMFDTGLISAVNPKTNNPPRKGSFSDEMRITFGGAV